MKISCTGHRLNKIGGYKIPNPTYDFILASAKQILLQLNPECVNVGGAIGFDQLVAELCVELKIPFHTYIPFLGQEKMWPKESQDKYNDLLSKSERVIVVCEGGYAPFKMQIRNCAMTDQLINEEDRLLSCWDGTPGGTANCIQYALKQKKKMVRIDPLKMTITDLENK